MAGVNIKKCCCGTCSHCTTTPLTVSVTFSGVDINPPCLGPGLLGSAFQGDPSSTPLGTYTLTQIFDSCLWTVQTTGPNLFYFVESSTCVTFRSNTTNLFIQIEMASDTSLTLSAWNGVSGGNRGNWFHGTTSPSSRDCCTGTTINNDYVSYTTTQTGKNGSAALTPHC